MATTDTGQFPGGPDDFGSKSSNFMTWLLAHPGATVHPSVALADYRHRHAGRGMKATADIPRATELFRIPRAAVLSVDTSALPGLLPSIFDPNVAASPLPPWTALILVLIYETQRRDSPWRPYLDLLPTTFDTPMFWSNAELAELRGCAVVDKIGRAAADIEFHATVLPILKEHRDTFFPSGDSNGVNEAEHNGNNNNDTIDVDDDATLLALAHRMGSTIMAYAFDVEWARGFSSTSSSSSSDEDEEDEDDTPKAMVPLADLLNAEASPAHNARLFWSDDALTMKATSLVRAGDEVFNDYGPVPRGDLLRRYGYVSASYSGHDAVELHGEAVVRAAAAYAGLASGDVEERLSFLRDEGVYDGGGYDVVWEQHNEEEGHLTAPFMCLLLTLLVQRKHYKLPVRDPGAVVVPETAVRRVVAPLLRERLAEYPWDFDGDAALLKDPDKIRGRRRRMAVEVRHGEMELLRAAVAYYQDDENDATADDGVAADDDAEPKSKRQRVG